jgi:hypothetical protein
LKIALLLNFILAASSTAVLILALAVFWHDQVWEFFYIAKTICFWLLVSTIPWGQVIYLRWRLNRQARPKTERFKTALLAGNLVLVLIIGFFGLEGLRLEASFTGTWLHVNILKTMAIFVPPILLALANIKILRSWPNRTGGPERVAEKKNYAG